MTDELAIHAAGVSKRYTKYDDSPMLATALLRFRHRSKRSTLWAVRDVNLDVKRGECVGIIGANGSGKSTLLQMVSGITAPTEGRVVVRGRIAPLISVGVGFHPEMSGRDNVYVNGTILGMSRAEIDRRFDDIVAFAEIAEFIDTPVKFYSSGMTVRLGFSVAVAADPELLIVDEVLAVGDVAFQAKCFNRMAEIRENGTTVLVVSHSHASVQRLCSRALLMHRGEVVFEGAPADAIGKHYEMLGATQTAQAADTGLPDTAPPYEAGVVDIVDCALIDASGQAGHILESQDRVRTRVRVRFLADVEAPYLQMTLRSDAGTVIYHDTNRWTPYAAVRAGEERVFELEWSPILTKGGYAANVVVGRARPDGNVTMLGFAPPVQFFIGTQQRARGLVDLGGEFREQPRG